MPKLKDTKSAKTSKGRRQRGRHKALEFSKAELAELKKVGQGIRKLVADTGKSNRIFAYESDISASHLYDLINGNTDPRFTTLRKVAKGLGFKSVSALLSKIL